MSTTEEAAAYQTLYQFACGLPDDAVVLLLTPKITADGVVSWPASASGLVTLLGERLAVVPLNRVRQEDRHRTDVVIEPEGKRWIVSKNRHGETGQLFDG